MERGRFGFRKTEKLKVNGQLEDYFENGSAQADETHLKKSDELDFLNESAFLAQNKPVSDSPSWSLYSEGKKLEPLRFSNGKTQEDIVKEVVGLIKSGTKIVLIHGMCGTGKSVVALNIARVLGKSAIVVPVKSLQRQYEEDYMKKKYLFSLNGRKMKIAMITGRDNHDSIMIPGVSCADPNLPDTIKIIEKNYNKIEEYYLANPLISNNAIPDINRLKRIAIAPANPYWSPIVNAVFELPLRDAEKKKYRGLNGKNFIFYHRKRGCSYFDQCQAYIDADVIIFNSAKYKIEVALDRKPETEVDIIDEADEFLDNFSTQEEINLSRLTSALNNVQPDNFGARDAIRDIQELIKLEEKNKQALGIDESKIFHINETKVEKILSLFLEHPEIEAEASLDEKNYTNHAAAAAMVFEGLLDDVYVTFSKKDKDLYVNLVAANLSKRFKEIINKNKAVVLMSGTLHSDIVLKNIFGISDFKVVEAETLPQGSIEILRTGSEFDCKYANFKSGKYSRKDYLFALAECIKKAKKPFLAHVNAFEDLPTEKEIVELAISNVISREKLIALQAEDKTGKLISLFKAKLSDELFTTKCSRGVDFPGDVCNSVIFTKYPNPNVRGTFWKILEKTHPEYYWDFYKDKARRDFLQRIYRALRSKDDHVYVLSPDIRVLNAVRELQLGNF